VGREALVHAEVGDETGEVRALLESAEMILRGAIRRRFPKSSIKSVTVKSDTLCFTCAGELVRLHLGPRAAEAWRKAIAVPPPGLRAKLGLDKGARALLVGSFDDDVLANALKGVIVKDGLDAAMLIVCVRGAGDLAAAQAIHVEHPGFPLWTIYPKGRGAAFGEREIRTALRAAGFHDTKSCTVSGLLTATRYNFKQGSPGEPA
jgi:hypothetical protein